MRSIAVTGSVVFLALSPLACAEADAGSAASGTAAANAEAPDGPPVYYLLSGPAKRYCSGIWVSERDRTEALYGSVLHTEEQVHDYESGSLAIDIDEEMRIVTVSQDGVSARARHFGDQGCVILPPDTDGVFFTPREVVSALPDAETTPWPMGDMLPDEPLPEGVNGELLDQAVETFFTEGDNRAAFLVVHRGRVLAEDYGPGIHKDTQLESWSMAKSMTATLIGRLIQMGHLEIWQPAPVPEWQNSPGDPRAEIRIADLLRMSSGLRFSNSGATPEQMAASFVPGQVDHRMGYVAPIDAFQFSISRDAEFPPNTVGRYRNSDPWTLGYIVQRAVETSWARST